MDRNILKSQWSRYQGALQEYWDGFTGKEVAQINGEWDTLVRKLQEKYSFSRSEAEEEIKYFMAEVAGDTGLEDEDEYIEEDSY
jgi:uncharacterized protein YjbJ (UPF0337 family)